MNCNRIKSFAQRWHLQRNTAEKKSTSVHAVLQVFFSFLKVGAIGFGGGSALIPVIEKEIVQNHKMITQNDFLKHTVVANITPGALPVKLGATCGYQYGGILGSMVGAYSVMLPGTLATVAVLALFSVLGESTVIYVEHASIGISIFILYLLLHYIYKTLRVGCVWINIALCGIATVLTVGGKLQNILYLVFGYESSSPPLFAISTISLMVLAFFMIVVKTLTLNGAAIWIAGGLSLLFMVFSGKLFKSRVSPSLHILVLLIMLLYLSVLFLRNKHNFGVKMRMSRSIVMTTVMFLAIPLALMIISAWMAGDTSIFGFMSKVCGSTIVSFGGGEAYVSVADGTFVQDSIISSNLFYTQLVPIANALPGPILIKVVAGIGYLFRNGGFVGWMLAATTATAATGVCCAIAVVIMHVYDRVKDSAFIMNLKQYILPVICGMLLSTCCAMLYESMSILERQGIKGSWSLCIMLAGVAVLALIQHKRRQNDILLIICLAATSIMLIGLV